MTKTAELAAKLRGLDIKNMYENDFFLTWDKSDDEIAAVFAVADALRDLRERNISTKIFDSGLGISNFRDNSTRTRFSFASACNLLGLEVQDLDEGKSQIAHGETVRETANMISFMADVVGIRDDMYIGKGHTYQKEVAEALKEGYEDGVLEQKPTLVNLQCDIDHPTQTLADLLTIYREKGKMDNLTIGLCGDLKFGRTVHSLINAMSRYEGSRFVLISPEELKVPSYVKKDVLQRKRIPYLQTTSLEDVMPQLDILYMTRVQRERFFNEEDYLRLKDSYILTPQKLMTAKEDLCIMHPLPRVNEISVAIDDDPRACYFKQVANGKYMRMALILKLLKEAGTI